MKAGAGICFTDGQKVLILKRASGRYANKWCLPGGKIEPKESVIEAAERECREECGKCEGSQFDRLSHIEGDFKWTCLFYKVNQLFPCQLNEEHLDWKWIDIDRLKEQALIPPFRRHLEKYIEKAKRAK